VDEPVLPLALRGEPTMTRRFAHSPMLLAWPLLVILWMTQFHSLVFAIVGLLVGVGLGIVLARLAPPMAGQGFALFAKRGPCTSRYARVQGGLPITGKKSSHQFSSRFLIIPQNSIPPWRGGYLNPLVVTAVFVVFFLLSLFLLGGAADPGSVFAVLGLFFQTVLKNAKRKKRAGEREPEKVVRVKEAGERQRPKRIARDQGREAGQPKAFLSLSLTEIRAWYEDQERIEDIEGEMDWTNGWVLKVRGFSSYGIGINSKKVTANQKVLVLRLEQGGDPQGYWVLYPGRKEGETRLDEGRRMEGKEKHKTPRAIPGKLEEWLQETKEKISAQVLTKRINRAGYDQLEVRRVVLLWPYLSEEERRMMPNNGFGRMMGLVEVFGVTPSHLENFLTGQGYKGFTFLSMGYLIWKRLRERMDELRVWYMEERSLRKIQLKLMADAKDNEDQELEGMLKGIRGYQRLYFLFYRLGMRRSERVVGIMARSWHMVELDSPRHKGGRGTQHDEVADSGLSPEEELLRKEAIAEAQQRLGNESPDVREVVTMLLSGDVRLREGNEFEDAAQALGITVEEVVVLFEQGLRILEMENGGNGNHGEKRHPSGTTTTRELGSVLLWPLGLALSMPQIYPLVTAVVGLLALGGLGILLARLAVSLLSPRGPPVTENKSSREFSFRFFKPIFVAVVFIVLILLSFPDTTFAQDEWIIGQSSTLLLVVALVFVLVIVFVSIRQVRDSRKIRRAFDAAIGRPGAFSALKYELRRQILEGDHSSMTLRHAGLTPVQRNIFLLILEKQGKGKGNRNKPSSSGSKGKKHPILLKSLALLALLPLGLLGIAPGPFWLAGAGIAMLGLFFILKKLNRLGWSSRGPPFLLDVLHKLIYRNFGVPQDSFERPSVNFSVGGNNNGIFGRGIVHLNVTAALRYLRETQPFKGFYNLLEGQKRRFRAHTASSRILWFNVGRTSLGSGSKYSSIASLILLTVSFWVLPWLQHPLRDGQWATIYPSSPFSSTILSFIFLPSFKIFLISILSIVGGIKRVKRIVGRVLPAGRQVSYNSLVKAAALILLVVFNIGWIGGNAWLVAAAVGLFLVVGILVCPRWAKGEEVDQVSEELTQLWRRGALEFWRRVALLYNVRGPGLDVGSYDSTRVAEGFKGAGIDVTMLDRWAISRSVRFKNGQRRCKGFRFIQGNAKSLTDIFDEQFFGCVVFAQSIHHILQDEGPAENGLRKFQKREGAFLRSIRDREFLTHLMEQAFRVLKDGGRIFIFDLAYYIEEETLDLGEVNLKEVLESHPGFDEVEVISVGHYQQLLTAVSRKEHSVNHVSKKDHAAVGEKTGRRLHLKSLNRHLNALAVQLAKKSDHVDGMDIHYWGSVMALSDDEGWMDMNDLGDIDIILHVKSSKTFSPGQLKRIKKEFVQKIRISHRAIKIRDGIREEKLLLSSLLDRGLLDIKAQADPEGKILEIIRWKLERLGQWGSPQKKMKAVLEALYNFGWIEDFAALKAKYENARTKGFLVLWRETEASGLVSNLKNWVAEQNESILRARIRARPLRWVALEQGRVSNLRVQDFGAIILAVGLIVTGVFGSSSTAFAGETARQAVALYSFAGPLVPLLVGVSGSGLLASLVPMLKAWIILGIIFGIEWFVLFRNKLRQTGATEALYVLESKETFKERYDEFFAKNFGTLGYEHLSVWFDVDMDSAIRDKFVISRAAPQSTNKVEALKKIKVLIDKIYEITIEQFSQQPSFQEEHFILIVKGSKLILTVYDIRGIRARYEEMEAIDYLCEKGIFFSDEPSERFVVLRKGDGGWVLSWNGQFAQFSAHTHTVDGDERPSGFVGPLIFGRDRGALLMDQVRQANVFDFGKKYLNDLKKAKAGWLWPRIRVFSWKFPFVLLLFLPSLLAILASRFILLLLNKGKTQGILFIKITILLIGALLLMAAAPAEGPLEGAFWLVGIAAVGILVCARRAWAGEEKQRNRPGAKETQTGKSRENVILGSREGALLIGRRLYREYSPVAHAIKNLTIVDLRTPFDGYSVKEVFGECFVQEDPLMRNLVGILLHKINGETDCGYISRTLLFLFYSCFEQFEKYGKYKIEKVQVIWSESIVFGHMWVRVLFVSQEDWVIYDFKPGFHQPNVFLEKSTMNEGVDYYSGTGEIDMQLIRSNSSIDSALSQKGHDHAVLGEDVRGKQHSSGLRLKSLVALTLLPLGLLGVAPGPLWLVGIAVAVGLGIVLARLVRNLIKDDFYSLRRRYRSLSTTISVLSKSETFNSARTFLRTARTWSAVRVLNFRTITPWCERGGYKSILQKSWSWVKNSFFLPTATLSSVPLEVPSNFNSLVVLTSNPRLRRKSTFSLSTHSSAMIWIFILLLSGIFIKMNFFVEDNPVGIMDAGLDVFFGNGGKMIVDNFIKTVSCLKKVEDLVNHNPMPFDAGLAMAYLWIYGNAFQKILHKILLISILSIIGGIRRVKGIAGQVCRVSRNSLVKAVALILMVVFNGGWTGENVWLGAVVGVVLAIGILACPRKARAGEAVVEGYQEIRGSGDRFGVRPPPLTGSVLMRARLEKGLPVRAIPRVAKIHDGQVVRDLELDEDPTGPDILRGRMWEAIQELPSNPTFARQRKAQLEIQLKRGKRLSPHAKKELAILRELLREKEVGIESSTQILEDRSYASAEERGDWERIHAIAATELERIEEERRERLSVRPTEDLFRKRRITGVIREIWQANQRDEFPGGINLASYSRNYGQFAVYALILDLRRNGFTRVVSPQEFHTHVKTITRGYVIMQQFYLRSDLFFRYAAVFYALYQRGILAKAGSLVGLLRLLKTHESLQGHTDHILRAIGPKKKVVDMLVVMYGLSPIEVEAAVGDWRIPWVGLPYKKLKGLVGKLHELMINGRLASYGNLVGLLKLLVDDPQLPGDLRKITKAIGSKKNVADMLVVMYGLDRGRVEEALGDWRIPKINLPYQRALEELRKIGENLPEIFKRLEEGRILKEDLRAIWWLQKLEGTRPEDMGSVFSLGMEEISALQSEDETKLNAFLERNQWTKLRGQNNSFWREVARLQLSVNVQVRFRIRAWLMEKILREEIIFDGEGIDREMVEKILARMQVMKVWGNRVVVKSPLRRIWEYVWFGRRKFLALAAPVPGRGEDGRLLEEKFGVPPTQEEGLERRFSDRELKILEMIAEQIERDGEFDAEALAEEAGEGFTQGEIEAVYEKASQIADANGFGKKKKVVLRTGLGTTIVGGFIGWHFGLPAPSEAGPGLGLLVGFLWEFRGEIAKLFKAHLPPSAGQAIRAGPVASTMLLAVLSPFFLGLASFAAGGLIFVKGKGIVGRVLSQVFRNRWVMAGALAVMVVLNGGWTGSNLWLGVAILTIVILAVVGILFCPGWAEAGGRPVENDPVSFSRFIYLEGYEFRLLGEIFHQLNGIYYELRGGNIYEDFRTSSSASSLGAQARAKEFYQTLEDHEGDIRELRKIVVYEWGIGDGRFAADFLDHFEILDHEKKYYARLMYVLADRSRSALGFARQNERLTRHQDILSFVRFDALGGLPFADYSAMLIQFEELYDDLGDVEKIIKTGEKEFYRYVGRLRISSEAKFESNDGRVIHAREFKEGYWDKGIEGLKEVKISFLSNIEIEEQLETDRIDLEKHPFGRFIQESTARLSRSVFPLNLGAVQNLERASSLLDLRKGGYLRLSDYGFILGRQSEDVDPMRFISVGIAGARQPTARVNFGLLKWALRNDRVRVLIESESNFVSRLAGQRILDREFLNQHLNTIELLEFVVSNDQGPREQGSVMLEMVVISWSVMLIHDPWVRKEEWMRIILEKSYNFFREQGHEDVPARVSRLIDIVFDYGNSLSEKFHLKVVGSEVNIPSSAPSDPAALGEVSVDQGTRGTGNQEGEDAQGRKKYPIFLKSLAAIVLVVLPLGLLGFAAPTNPTHLFTVILFILIIIYLIGSIFEYIWNKEEREKEREEEVRRILKTRFPSETFLSKRARELYSFGDPIQALRGRCNPLDLAESIGTLYGPTSVFKVWDIWIAIAEAFSLREEESFKILDAGSGLGHFVFATALLLSNADVVGVELSPGMVEEANRILKKLKIQKVSFIQANILDHDIDISQYDYIFHYPPVVKDEQVERFYSEFSQRLIEGMKPGARLIVAVSDRSYFKKLEQSPDFEVRDVFFFRKVMISTSDVIVYTKKSDPVYLSPAPRVEASADLDRAAEGEEGVKDIRISGDQEGEDAQGRKKHPIFFKSLAAIVLVLLSSGLLGVEQGPLWLVGTGMAVVSLFFVFRKLNRLGWSVRGPPKLFNVLYKLIDRNLGVTQNSFKCPAVDLPVGGDNNGILGRGIVHLNVATALRYLRKTKAFKSFDDLLEGQKRWFRAHTASSRILWFNVGRTSLGSGSKYSSIASLILLTVSFWVLPWLQHPLSDGQWATIYPSSPFSSTILSLILLASFRIFFISIPSIVGGIKSVKGIVGVKAVALILMVVLSGGWVGSNLWLVTAVVGLFLAVYFVIQLGLMISRNLAGKSSTLRKFLSRFNPKSPFAANMTLSSGLSGYLAILKGSGITFGEFLLGIGDINQALVGMKRFGVDRIAICRMGQKSARNWLGEFINAIHGNEEPFFRKSFADCFNPLGFYFHRSIISLKQRITFLLREVNILFEVETIGLILLVVFNGGWTGDNPWLVVAILTIVILAAVGILFFPRRADAAERITQEQKDEIISRMNALKERRRKPQSQRLFFDLQFVAEELHDLGSILVANAIVLRHVPSGKHVLFIGHPRTGKTATARLFIEEFSSEDRQGDWKLIAHQNGILLFVDHIVEKLFVRQFIDYDGRSLEFWDVVENGIKISTRNNIRSSGESALIDLIVVFNNMCRSSRRIITTTLNHFRKHVVREILLEEDIASWGHLFLRSKRSLIRRSLLMTKLPILWVQRPEREAPSEFQRASRELLETVLAEINRDRVAMDGNSDPAAGDAGHQGGEDVQGRKKHPISLKSMEELTRKAHPSGDAGHKTSVPAVVGKNTEGHVSPSAGMRYLKELTIPEKQALMGQIAHLIVDESLSWEDIKSGYIYHIFRRSSGNIESTTAFFVRDRDMVKSWRERHTVESQQQEKNREGIIFSAYLPLRQLRAVVIMTALLLDGGNITQATQRMKIHTKLFYVSCRKERNFYEDFMSKEWPPEQRLIEFLEEPWVREAVPQGAPSKGIGMGEIVSLADLDSLQKKRLLEFVTDLVTQKNMTWIEIRNGYIAHVYQRCGSRKLTESILCVGYSTLSLFGFKKRKDFARDSIEGIELGVYIPLEELKAVVITAAMVFHRGKAVEAAKSLNIPIGKISEHRKRHRSLHEVLRGKEEDRRQSTDDVGASIPFSALTEDMVEFFRIAQGYGFVVRPPQLEVAYWLTQKGIAVEFDAGEGKTLATTLAAYLKYKKGQKIRVITLNIYLAYMGATTMGPILSDLGLRVGFVGSVGQYAVWDSSLKDFRKATAREALEADVVYAAYRDLIGEYLRWQIRGEEIPLNDGKISLICDEADVYMVNDSATPIVLVKESGQRLTREDADFQLLIEKAARFLERLMTPENYQVEQRTGCPFWTRTDIPELLKRHLSETLSPSAEMPSDSRLRQLAEKSLVAYKGLQRDRDYRKHEGKIILRHGPTNRLGSSYRLDPDIWTMLGIKEGLKVNPPDFVVGIMSLEQFFELHPGGIHATSATLTSVAEELRENVGLEVKGINEHFGQDGDRGRSWPIVYRNTLEERNDFILQQVMEALNGRRPVGVIMPSVGDVENMFWAIKSTLKEEGFTVGSRYRVGRDGMVVDVQYNLGTGETLTELKEEGERFRRAGMISDLSNGGIRVPVLVMSFPRGADIRNNRLTEENGGMHLILAETHGSKSADWQALLRVGRGGDRATRVQVISLESEVVRRFMPEGREGEPITEQRLQETIEQAIHDCEGFERQQRISLKALVVAQTRLASDLFNVSLEGRDLISEAEQARLRNLVVRYSDYVHELISRSRRLDVMSHRRRVMVNIFLNWREYDREEEFEIVIKDLYDLTRLGIVSPRTLIQLKQEAMEARKNHPGGKKTLAQTRLAEVDRAFERYWRETAPETIARAMRLAAESFAKVVSQRRKEEFDAKEGKEPVDPREEEDGVPKLVDEADADDLGVVDPLEKLDSWEILALMESLPTQPEADRLIVSGDEEAVLKGIAMYRLAIQERPESPIWMALGEHLARSIVPQRRDPNIKKYPVLTKAQTLRLGMLKDEFSEIRWHMIHVLVEHNRGFVVAMARKYEGRSILDVDDLIQEGMMGLRKATIKYDYKRGLRFLTPAHWWIRTSIQRAIADTGATIRHPVYLVTAVSHARAINREFRGKHGRNMTPEELEDALRKEVAIYNPKKVVALMYFRQPISLQKPVNGDEDIMLEDCIGEEGDYESLENLDWMLQLMTEVNRSFGDQDERLKAVVLLRIGIVNNLLDRAVGNYKILQELREHFGLSVMMIVSYLADRFVYEKLTSLEQALLAESYGLSAEAVLSGYGEVVRLATNRETQNKDTVALEVIGFVLGMTREGVRLLERKGIMRILFHPSDITRSFFARYLGIQDKKKDILLPSGMSLEKLQALSGEDIIEMRLRKGVTTISAGKNRLTLDAVQVMEILPGGFVIKEKSLLVSAILAAEANSAFDLRGYVEKLRSLGEAATEHQRLELAVAERLLEEN